MTVAVDGELAGRTAVVVGGSRGIGAATATALARVGAHVMVVSRDPESVTAQVAAITAEGFSAEGRVLDANDPSALSGLAAHVIGERGGLDVLVNNTGVAPFLAPVEQIDPDGFIKYLGRNVAPAFLGLRAFATALESTRGCVVTVASVGAFLGSPGMAYYGAAKAALVNLTKTVAQEWAPRRVRVNAVAPGWVRTDMSAAQHGDPAQSETLVAQVPLGRWGEPEDIAEAVVFLSSPRASYVTGTVLVVDGGLSLGAGLHG